MNLPSASWIVTASLVLGSQVALAADLSKIDRTIRKEPTYKTTPKYCLLVFGPRADTRVWLVLDGDVLYVDRNSNGDLTDTDERVVDKRRVDWGGGSWHDEYDAGRVTVTETGEKCYLTVTTHSDKEGRKSIWQARVSPEDTKSGWQQSTDGAIALSPKAKDAAVVHFGGQLTLTIMDWGGGLQHRRLERDKDPPYFSILVGTPVYGNKSEAFVTLKSNFDKLAGDVFPSIDVEFPGKGPRDQPIRAKAKAKY